MIRWVAFLLVAFCVAPVSVLLIVALSLGLAVKGFVDRFIFKKENV